LTQNAEGQGESNARPSIAGDVEMTYPLVGFSAELMSPELPIPTHPRVFIHADTAMSFSSTWKVAFEGKAGNPELPQPGPNIPATQISVTAVSGTGSQVTAEARPFEFSAGAGLSFEFEVWERTLRLRPSFEYRRETLEYSLLLSNAVTSNPIDRCDPYCSLAEIGQNKRSTLHGIGPGVEIEMDAARAASLVFSVYASAQAYHYLGSRKTSISASGNYTPPAEPSEEPILFNATVEQEAWSYRGLVGLRLRWLPE